MDLPISRWDEQNYEVTFEAFTSPSKRDILFNNIVPGAVSEITKILGVPLNMDTTYASGNSLIIDPLTGSGLEDLRERRTVAIKSASDSIITPNKIAMKFQCVRLDTMDL